MGPRGERIESRTEPRTWHYGLVAKWWAEFNNSGPEIEYFRTFVERGQPALDAACGTGRLLLPYLRAGLDVDGCDISEDMIALCRERAEAEGLAPRLYVQPMHELDLPRRYQTVVFCGGFALGGNREQDQEGLCRVFEHLESGGILVMDNEVPYNYTGDWKYWLAENRSSLPKPWPSESGRKTGSDGAEYALTNRLVDLDPLTQRVTYEMHARMWHEGDLVKEEKGLLKMTLYFKDEIILMLEKAGFTDVEVRGQHNDAAPTADDGTLVFIATRRNSRAERIPQSVVANR